MTDLLTPLCEAAARFGFDLVGVTSAEVLAEDLEHLEAWTAAGHHADLGWMARNPPERADPRTLLRDVRSVVTVAVHHAHEALPFVAEGRYGRVARYAWGLDYHDVMIPRLRALAAMLPGRAKVAVDHSPLLERAMAARAGLGFFGKNTCLLLPRRGSWFLLGELLLDVELPPTAPAPVEGCGTCTRCLAACPTDALPAPHVLDARRCLSYLTIEHRGFVPRALRARLGPWVFGCDVCQEVCPFNRFESPAPWPELEPRRGVGPRLDLLEALALPDEEAFRARFLGTPLLRARRKGLLRNAAIVARNVGAASAVPLLGRLAREDAEPLLRGHALWALFGLDPAGARKIAEVRLRDADPLVRAEATAGLEGLV